MVLAAVLLGGMGYVAVALLLPQEDGNACQADEHGDHGTARELKIGSIGQKHWRCFSSIGRWDRWYTTLTEKH
ncbi:MAG TPA: hypothetical protein VK832_10190, partial [Burkholderiaceae bacterium]|nr:hypothetical protein [Burkholderiaceae bacterium]